MFNIILLGITSLLNDFSSEMIFPILPFFIKSLGGGGIAIGLVFGIGDAVAAVIKVFSGALADRTGRYKVLTFAGYAFSTIAKFGYAIFANLGAVAAIYPIERIGKGLRDAPRDAIVSESLPPDRRGGGFGIQRAMDSVGAILGSLTVLIFFLHYGLAFHRIFLLSALVGISGLVPLLFVKVPAGLHATVGRRVSLAALTPQLRRFIAVATLFALGAFSYAFLILQTQASFIGLDAHGSLELALIIYIFFNLFDAALSAPAGALSDRIGRKRVVLLGYGSFAIVSFGFLGLSLLHPATSVTFMIALVLFIMYGAYKALIDASQRALVSDLSAPEIRGTALGTFQTLTGLAAIPAGLIAGVLWNVGPVYLFIYGTAVSLAACGCLAIVLRHHAE
jgi:MFS family permease